MAAKPLIAITGGTGFVGSHLIPELLSRGFKLRVMARDPQKLSRFSSRNLEVFPAALGADDFAFVRGADVVLHLAGLIKARTRRDFMAVNAHAAGAMAGAAQSAGTARFVLLSSQAANQPQLSAYCASKQAGERAVKAAYKGKLAIIRAPAIFGPGDKATKPIFDLISKGHLLAAGGAGWQDRKVAMAFAPDFVRDLADIALSGAYDGRRVTPCSIGAVTMPDFAQAASQALGRPVTARPIAIPLIKAVAAATSISSRWLGKGHLTLGKLREFRYEDWTSEDVIQNPTPFIDALRITARSYET